MYIYSLTDPLASFSHQLPSRIYRNDEKTKNFTNHKHTTSNNNYDDVIHKTGSPPDSILKVVTSFAIRENGTNRLKTNKHFCTSMASIRAIWQLRSSVCRRQS